MTMNNNPHLDTQYAEGQLLGGRGRWDDDDPHLTYADFYERATCFHKRIKYMSAVEYVRRSKEHEALCKEFPNYAYRFWRGEKPTLND